MIRDFLDRFVSGAGPSRLRWWVCFSGALHLAMIVTLLVVPASTARRDLPAPVYTVDLVPGPPPAPRPEPVKPAPREPEPAPVATLPSPEDDEIGEVPVEPAVPKPPETVKAPKDVPPAPKEKVKAPPKPKDKVKKPAKPKDKVKKPRKPKVVKVKKPRKPKVVKVKKPAGKKVAARKGKAPKKPPVKVAAKSSAKPKGRKKSQVAERVRQRRIEDAVAIARKRAKLRQKAGVGQDGGGGIAAGGRGTGGGDVKGLAFVAYSNQVNSLVKEQWTWIGERKDLEVTVGFGIAGDGGIFGLKVLKFSGDTSYDESAVRAVRRADPLPPPPARYAREFAKVRVTFRPGDLDR